MPLVPESLPMATPFDPSEDPPGSIDPLGTLALAERLADNVLPGFTARMWRARLLTFTTLSGAMSDRVVRLMDGREDVRLEARLAFERLFVSALVRTYQGKDDSEVAARRRLPGSDLARTALAANEPLTRNNFLRGQAVNGPFGVMARLARNLGLVEPDGNQGRNAPQLLLAWSEERELPGILDDNGPSDRPGGQWAADVAKTVSKCLAQKEWPGAGHQIWDQLAVHLRLDEVGRKERAAMGQLLEGDETRRRLLGILRSPSVLAKYRAMAGTESRGTIERSILVGSVLPTLGDGPVDVMLGAAIKAINAYETVVALLQEVFDGLLWVLSHGSARSHPDTLLADPRLVAQVRRVSGALAGAVASLGRAIEEMRAIPALDDPALAASLVQFCDDAWLSGPSEQTLIEAVLARHERVQREKGKAPWIDRGREWTLLPGFGIADAEPPVHVDAYLHPFRIPNAYSILADLGQVPKERGNGEA